MQKDLTGAVSIAKLKRVLDVSGTPPVLLRSVHASSFSRLSAWSMLAFLGVVADPT